MPASKASKASKKSEKTPEPVSIKGTADPLLVRYDVGGGEYEPPKPVPIVVTVGCRTFRFGRKQAAMFVQLVEMFHKETPQSVYIYNDHAECQYTFWAWLSADGENLHADTSGFPPGACYRSWPWKPLRAALLLEEPAGPAME